jgi:hypothetical protein
LESRLVPGSRDGVANDRGQNPSVDVAPYRARPLPSAEVPANTSGDDIQAPPLLNDPRNRTAVRPIPARPLPQPGLAEPIPTRWASSRIQWPERRAEYSTEVVPVSELHPMPVESPRRLEPQRLRMKRFSSDSIESAPASPNGWRSARR